jgi:hypothetical protein
MREKKKTRGLNRSASVPGRSNVRTGGGVLFYEAAWHGHIAAPEDGRAPQKQKGRDLHTNLRFTIADLRF